MSVSRLRALFQHEMPAAIGAIDLAFLAQGQKDTRMAQGAVTPVTGDFAAFDFDHFNRIHDVATSFTAYVNHFKAIAPPVPGAAGPGGASLTVLGADDTCVRRR
jgi:hypothetical protein